MRCVLPIGLTVALTIGSMLGVVGCSRPHSTQAPAKVSLDQFVKDAAGDYSNVTIKLTPLPSTSGVETVGKPLFAVGVSTDQAKIDLASMAAYRTQGINYYNESWSFIRAPLPAERIRSLVASIQSDRSLWSEAVPPEAAISITLFKPLASGGKASELFVTRKSASAVAAKLTNAAIATNSFETTLHWEDNIW